MESMLIDGMGEFLNFIFSSHKRDQMPDTNEHGIQITPIVIDSDYAKKWNANEKDFVCITKNGELLNKSLYRIGGLGTNKIKGKKYFILLKYTEAFYDKSITSKTGTKDPKHLASHWCIIDKHGAEKIVFDRFTSPYLVKDSCIYSMDGKYYNIETGEFYGNSQYSLESKEYLFIKNSYDENKEKRGVLKIDKKTGKFEFFKDYL